VLLCNELFLILRPRVSIPSTQILVERNPVCSAAFLERTSWVHDVVALKISSRQRRTSKVEENERMYKFVWVFSTMRAISSAKKGGVKDDVPLVTHD
jgi:hypothetical protein